MATETIRMIYGVFLVLALLVSAWMVIVTWRWKRVPGAKPLIVMEVGVGIWILCAALDLFGFYQPVPYFWSKLTFLGIAMVPGGFLVWAARFTQSDGWVNKYTLGLLCIEPILVQVWVWLYPAFFFGLVLLTGKMGPGFNLHTLYSYLVLMLTGYVMLFIYWLRLPPAHKSQGAVLLLAILFSTGANVLTLVYTLPKWRIDLSPLGLVIATLLFTYAQLRHRLFDIMPVARNAVVEGMRDGMMVLDPEDRIIDMNPAAQTMMGVSVKSVMGELAESALPPWAGIERQIGGQAEANFEHFIETDTKLHIDFSISTMFDKRHHSAGRLVIMRDITHLKKIEGDLRETNKELLHKIEEIEMLQEQLRQQAIRDPLTGLYNRRFLEETLGRELAQAQRTNEAMSVAMLDIDHFKNVNDTYGHSVGDMFLIALGDLLEQQTRAGDVACRFGGEEFIVVMPGAPLDVAAKRVNEFRQAFCALKIDVSGKSVSASFSAGVAGFPLHGMDDKTIIAEADRALYAAKEAGRNRVIVAQREYI